MSRREGSPASVFDPSDRGPTDASVARDGAFAALIAASYTLRVGQPLAPSVAGPDLGLWLYERAPFCLLAHNAAANPRFVYANRAAQSCFETDWDALTRLPSRLSAAPDARAERQAFIDAVRRDGFATGYSGPRVSRSGRVFVIEDVTMWQITDPSGVLLGEAATYARWRPT